MNLLTATSAQASASGAAVAVRAVSAFGFQAETRSARSFAAAHTAKSNAMGVASITGFVCKRGERDSWTNMGSCGCVEVAG